MVCLWSLALGNSDRCESIRLLGASRLVLTSGIGWMLWKSVTHSKASDIGLSEIRCISKMLPAVIT